MLCTTSASNSAIGSVDGVSDVAVPPSAAPWSPSDAHAVAATMTAARIAVREVQGPMMTSWGCEDAIAPGQAADRLRVRCELSVNVPVITWHWRLRNSRVHSQETQKFRPYTFGTAPVHLGDLPMSAAVAFGLDVVAIAILTFGLYFPRYRRKDLI